MIMTNNDIEFIIKRIDFIIERSLIYNKPIKSIILHPDLYNFMLLKKTKGLKHKEPLSYKKIPIILNSWMSEYGFCAITY